MAVFVIKVVVVAMVLGGAATAKADGGWERVYEELDSCLLSMNVCRTREGKYVRGIRTEADCIGGDEEDWAWVKKFQNWRELEIASKEAEENRARVFLGRILDEHTRGANRLLMDTILEQGTDQVRLGDFLRCNDAHYVFLIGPSNKMQDACKGVCQSFALPSEMKLSPEVESWEARMEHRIQLVPGEEENLDEIARRWKTNSQGRRLQVQVFTNSTKHVHVSIETQSRNKSAEFLSWLSREAEVLWIEPKVEYELLNVDAAMLTQSGISLGANDRLGESLDDLSEFWKQGLHGEGEVVGVGDSGLDTQSCFFKDNQVDDGTRDPGTVTLYPEHRKVVQYHAFADGGEGEEGGHGTHVVGSVAGHGDEDLADLFKGMAYRAKIAFFDIGFPNSQSVFPPDALATTMFPPAYDVGARLHTNSWGGNLNAYTTDAREVDTFSFENQDFLILFANGNAGTSNGQVGTVGTPATAKNCLSVGASMNSDRSFSLLDSSCPSQAGSPCTENMADFSSDGPTYDNRIKPDVVAPGYFIGSAKSSATCDVTFFAGTSMATPVVAGNAALVRQYFREGYYPIKGSRKFTPMGALIKAVLINSGKYLKGGYNSNTPNLVLEPSFVQGFGRVQLNNTLGFGSNRRRTTFVRGDFEEMPKIAETGAKDKYTFVIPPGSLEDVKITLVWHDPPASLQSRTALVNDLDLRVEDEQGNTLYHPNGRNQPDGLNNVEQIVIKRTEEQALFSNGFTIVAIVEGASIPFGPQPYAIVATGGFSLSQGGIETDDGLLLALDENTAGDTRNPGRTFGIMLLIMLILGGAMFIVFKYREQITESMENLKAKMTPSNSSNLQTGGMQLSTRPAIPQPLPHGWEAAVDPSTGEQYYFNRALNQSSWTPPEPSTIAARPPVPPAKPAHLR